VIEQLERDGVPVVVTRHGQPVAALTLVSEQQAAALALAVVPEYLASRERAASAIERHEGKPASQLLAELESEDTEDGGTDLDEATLEVGVELDKDIEIAAGPERLTIPMSWVKQVAALSVPVGLIGAGPIQALNVELVSTFMSASVAALLRSVHDRVRTVNENIAAELGGEGDEVSVEAYATKLERVAAAERLTLRVRSR
jgi:antitoxin (DNA-binding transcriptional repressor) of toxin-antitoxin stability system